MAYLLVSIPFVTVLVWTSALVVDPGPYDPIGVLLIGTGMLVLSVVGVTGILLVGGRWARVASLLALGGCLVIAVARPIDVIWVIGLISCAAGIVALFSPPVVGWVRKLPAATGPPPRAVVLAIGLLAVPLALGLALFTGSTVATLIVGIAALATALLYSRVVIGGLFALRYGWPALAVMMSLFQPLPPAVMSAVLGISVAVAARDPSVKVAFYPPVESGSPQPILPELVPKEVRDAAEIDERGRRQ